MQHIAIIYHSAHGHTAHIAQQVCQGARGVPGIQAELVLAGATTVYAVPPAAVAMTSETGGCVEAIDGGALPVTVVSSKLGRTYVSFAEPPTASSIEAVAAKDLTCS